MSPFVRIIEGGLVTITSFGTLGKVLYEENFTPKHPLLRKKTVPTYGFKYFCVHCFNEGGCYATKHKANEYKKWYECNTRDQMMYWCLFALFISWLYQAMVIAWSRDTAWPEADTEMECDLVIGCETITVRYCSSPWLGPVFSLFLEASISYANGVMGSAGSAYPVQHWPHPGTGPL